MKSLLVTFKLWLLLSLVTGVLYPLLIFVIAQVVFPFQSNGSFIKKESKMVGSDLISQKFSSARYFGSRPSAIDYNPLDSGGSNLGPTSSKLKEAVQNRGADNKPKSLLFTSASGLDPHVTVRAIQYEKHRVAQARRLTNAQESVLEYLINKHTEVKFLRIFGQERVNVLKLNLDMDREFGEAP